MPAELDESTGVHVAAVVVGVDTYPCDDELGDLDGAVGDAESFAQALRRIWPTAEITELTGSPTLKEVNSALYELQFRTPDLVIFYFSGHGIVRNHGSFLCTGDTAAGNEGLELTQLIRRLGGNGLAFSWLAVLDCCHAAPEQMRNNYITRADIESTMTYLGVSRAALAACGPAAESVITGDGRSPFTDAVIAGLNGAASNPDGNVTVNSLYDFVVALGKSGLPEPVLVGDFTDSFVLRSDLEPRGSRGLSRQSIDDLCDKATRLVSSLHKHLAVDDSRWRQIGWTNACREITPIERWFTTKAKDQPELVQDERFRSARKALDRIVAYVSNVSEGIRTDHGVIGEQIGEGGFGAVWTLRGLGRQDPMKALKVYHTTELRNWEKRLRFEHGYRAMEQLRHPRIAKVEKFIETPPAIVMELIDGPNLRDFTDFPDGASKLQFMADVCETLDHAHTHGVVHRDVKPENIIVTVDGKRWQPVLTDFDLAWFTTATEVTKNRMGHILYAAPEQLLDSTAGESRMPLADVYSVGQVLYFLLVGTDPRPYDEIGNIERLRISLTREESGLNFAAARLVNIYSAAIRSTPGSRTRNMRILWDELKSVIHIQEDMPNDARLDFRAFISQAIRRAKMVISDSRGQHKICASSPSGRVELEIIQNMGSSVPPCKEIQARFRPRVYSRRQGHRGVVQARQQNRARVESMVAVDSDVRVRAVSKGFFVGELLCEFTEYNFELAKTFGRRLQRIVAAAER